VFPTALEDVVLLLLPVASTTAAAQLILLFLLPSTEAAVEEDADAPKPALATALLLGLDSAVPASKLLLLLPLAAEAAGAIETFKSAQTELLKAIVLLSKLPLQAPVFTALAVSKALPLVVSTRGFQLLPLVAILKDSSPEAMEAASPCLLPTDAAVPTSIAIMEVIPTTASPRLQPLAISSQVKLLSLPIFCLRTPTLKAISTLQAFSTADAPASSTTLFPSSTATSIALDAPPVPILMVEELQPTAEALQTATDATVPAPFSSTTATAAASPCSMLLASEEMI
jgi:hypothetical protein